MEWKIKKFDELTTTQLYKILSLREEVFIMEQNCAYKDIDYKDLVSHHLFLERDEEVISYLRILPRKVTFDEMCIGRVVTKKEYRGQGISQEMLKLAIDYIENTLGEKEIRISAQAHLQKFYGSFGFKAVSEIYLEDGIDHIEMYYKEK